MEIANKLNLVEDNPMADSTTAAPGTSAITPPTKKWFKSKTVWSAILTAILGSVQPISTAFGHPYQIPLWVFEFLAGAGLYSLRTATTTIDNSTPS